MSCTDIPLKNYRPGEQFIARQLAPDEIVTPGCKRLIEGDFIGVFTTGVTASEFSDPIYKFTEAGDAA
ncbi:hypothetical protein [Thalassolituus sp.]|uniref:hypothetical protein n=1 Tax=Thalassolituus sp. TaxID=2030822 RepID=UPI0026131BAC|nr:hypothetical protein [Thalassolituus sp.]